MNTEEKEYSRRQMVEAVVIAIMCTGIVVLNSAMFWVNSLFGSGG